VRDYNALCNPFKEQLFAELNSMKPAEGKVKRPEFFISSTYLTENGKETHVIVRH
jgi:hypothetical protein